MDPARATELLARERARIERELQKLRPESDEELSHVDQHLADSGTELYEDERDEGLADRFREELAAIERAEKRVQEGTYGRSIISGEPIPDARLEAVPWAELTVDEQSRREHGA